MTQRLNTYSSSFRTLNSKSFRFAPLAFAAFAMVSLSTNAHAQGFEGSITLRLPSGPRGSGMQDVEYLSRAGNVRVNMTSPAGAIGVLGLSSEKKVYVIIEAQRSYMEVPPLDAIVAAGTPPTVTKTGKTETIAGFECEHVIIEAGSANGPTKTDVCLTRALGPFVNPMTALAGARMAPWQRQLMAEGGFPLKVTLNDGSVALEVTKVEKRRVSDSLFRIPTEFNKMDLPKRP